MYFLIVKNQSNQLLKIYQYIAVKIHLLAVIKNNKFLKKLTIFDKCTFSIIWSNFCKSYYCLSCFHIKASATALRKNVL